MKTKLIFLFLLIVCFSCGTNNKPISDAQKEKTKGEVKEVVNTFIKGCEEANFDLTIETIDSTDFIGLTNGITYGYKELMAMKPVFNTLLNQKCTIVNEKYTFLDKSTVLYTADSKWAVNYKDGHSTLEDPEAFMLMLKKIDSKWRVTYLVDSYVEKIVKYKEPSKELNQIELHKQFVGFWKAEMGKDTITFWDVKSYGTGIEGYFKVVAKGKIFMDGKQLWGYDKNLDKYVMSEMVKGMDNALYSSWFISTNKCVMLPYNDISNPDNASIKYEVEFKSPDILVQTTIVNNKPVKIDTMTRVK
jgi:hypothetical protein